MLDVKKLLAKITQKLKTVNEPTTLQVRPFSVNRTSDWSWQVTHTGILYLNFISGQRSYCTILWNGANIGDVVFHTESNIHAIVVPVMVKVGDTVAVNGLTNNCYLSYRSALITWG
ncbi:MAG: hypothetical protein IKE94_12850 [Aeriscardovia sp.]|nr:hypothetical protein [Aeriscardovia sp.]